MSCPYKFCKIFRPLLFLSHSTVFKLVKMTDFRSYGKTNDSGSLAEKTFLKRLIDVKGLDDKVNDIIYHSPENVLPGNGRVIFFGGDVQDYPENMMLHRDNKYHVEWNLENTAKLLHRKFPHWRIFIVKPSRMHLKTFSCYENFVDGNDNGVPDHEESTRSIRHLVLLLDSAEKMTLTQFSNSSQNKNDDTILIGFSKGCVVLNQLLHSFPALKPNDEELSQFVESIKNMYWLDGGHSGGSNTWITNKPVLKHFSSMGITANIHVSPYQVMCESRPWIKKEEKIFRESLKRLGAKVFHKFHFEDEARSLESHFRVLNDFI